MFGRADDAATLSLVLDAVDATDPLECLECLGVFAGLEVLAAGVSEAPAAKAKLASYLVFAAQRSGAGAVMTQPPHRHATTSRVMTVRRKYPGTYE